ncbi:MAG: ABC-type transport auxiliary lipoprotein family protein [Hyphomonadaceae bacterium]
MSRSAFVRAAALATAFALSGCVSVLPAPSVPKALIALPADRAEAPAAPLRADIAVFTPDATRAFSGTDLAVSSGQEMVYLADVRWADAAPVLLQEAVINGLSRAEGDGRAVPAQLGARVDYDLRWRIVDLSVSRQSGPVHAIVEASLVDSRTRRIVAQNRFEAMGEPDGRSSRERAAALAVVAQQVADKVAAFVAETAEPHDAAASGGRRNR